MADAEKRGPSDLRDLLIGAALQILEEPDTPLDLRKVAEVAGKSRTAPYLVFGKESEGGGLLSLRIAVAAEGAGRLARRMGRAAGGRSDPVVAFRALALAFLSFALHHPRLFRLMFGSDVGIHRLPSSTLDGHAEFQRLVRRRRRAEAALHQVIVACQNARLVPDVDEAGTLRYTMVAWATMVGVAFLLIDEVLPAAGMGHDLDDAASLVTESVLGVDPERLRDAAWTFVQAQAKSSTPETPQGGYGSHAIYEVRQASPMTFRSSAAGSPDPSVSDRGGPTGALSSHRGLRRAAQAREALYGARILWIDDEPESVRFEAETLRSLRAHVEAAPDTAAATMLLRQRSFDLILSDIARADDPVAGIVGLDELRPWAPDTPIVFYVRALDRSRGTPAGAFGIADDVDELFHLIVDALERRRG